MTDDLFTFDRELLCAWASHAAGRYAAAKPFAHIVIENFLPLAIAQRLRAEFPKPESGILKTRGMPQQPGKFGTLGGRNLARVTAFTQTYALGVQLSGHA